MLTSNGKDGANANLLSLDAVSQAIIILEHLEKGATTQEILDLAGGEASIVRAHFLFFKQMEWAEQEQKTENGKWHLTELGKNNLALLKTRWSEKPETHA